MLCTVQVVKLSRQRVPEPPLSYGVKGQAVGLYSSVEYRVRALKSKRVYETRFRQRLRHWQTQICRAKTPVLPNSDSKALIASIVTQIFE